MLLGIGEAVAGAARGPLAASVAVARDAERRLRGAVLSRAEPTALAAFDELLASRFADEVVDRALASPLARRTVERLLQTDELWLMVDEIARSPAVAEAIQRQSLGFADEVAGGVRVRSRRIDDRLESGARRMFGRKPRVPRAPEGNGA